MKQLSEMILSWAYTLIQDGLIHINLWGEPTNGYLVVREGVRISGCWGGGHWLKAAERPH